MIQATPFDLRLWTGINVSSPPNPAGFEDVYARFATRRDLLFDINKRLSGNPTVADCTLCIPLSQAMFEQLCNTPPWSEIDTGTRLHKLKVTVLSLLQSRQKAENVTVYLEPGEAEHFYEWLGPTDFFPADLAPDLCDHWVKVVGLCAFQDHVLLRNHPKPVAILSTWIVTDQPHSSKARLERQHKTRGEIERQRVPLISGTVIWDWEMLVRESLWKDKRLPFNGPAGPIGFCPPENWSPGEHPRRYQNAYRDALGGLWKWGGGRAVSDHNPFGGHWDVQLPDDSVKRRWVNWIEERSGRQISTRSNKISHINIEPDGRIDDPTFEWCD